MHIIITDSLKRLKPFRLCNLCAWDSVLIVPSFSGQCLQIIRSNRATLLILKEVVKCHLSFSLLRGEGTSPLTPPPDSGVWLILGEEAGITYE